MYAKMYAFSLGDNFSYYAIQSAWIGQSLQAKILASNKTFSPINRLPSASFEYAAACPDWMHDRCAIHILTRHFLLYSHLVLCRDYWWHPVKKMYTLRGYNRAWRPRSMAIWPFALFPLIKWGKLAALTPVSADTIYLTFLGDSMFSQSLWHWILHVDRIRMLACACE